MNLNWEKSLPKEYGFKALNNFTNLSLWTWYTDTMLVDTDEPRLLYHKT